MRHALLRAALTAGAVLFLFAPAAEAQTDVSGQITTNTTWTLAGSPYIAGPITITGATLTLEAGVEVVFAGVGEMISVDNGGRLDVLGTVSDPVVIRGRRTNAGTYFNDYGGQIEFRTGSSGLIEHAVLDSLGTARRWGSDHYVLEVFSSDVTVRDTEIRNSYSTAIRVGYDLQPTLTRLNLLNENQTYGLRYEGEQTLRAESIYWDDASGPYNYTLNPNGEGLRVSDNVDFRPWRTSPVQIQNAVDPPALFLSTASVASGGTLDISGSGFTPNADLRLYVTGPTGHLPVTATLTASDAGTFDYAFAVSAGATPPGTYVTSARDLTTTLSTPTKAFTVAGALAPAGFAVTAPRAGAVVASGQPVHVEWTDQLSNGPGYPAPVGTQRAYSYAVEVAVDGGPWTPTATATGVAPWGEPVTLSTSVALPPGSVRLRLVDTYDPSRLAESEPFTVRDASLDAVRVSLEWDHSFPRFTDPPVGVAADGVGRLYLRVASTDPGVDIERVDVALAGEGGDTGPAVLGKVMPATVTDAYSAEANAATGTTASSTGDAAEHWFWYVAPDNFARTGTTRSRTVYADVTVTLAGGQQARLAGANLDGEAGRSVPTTVRQEIAVVRPPLMLVHGLGSGPGLWDDFSLDGTTPYARDDRYVYKRAIPINPGGSVYGNAAERLLNPRLGDLYYPDSFHGFIRYLRKEGYAANRVHYVAHSMGGNVLRAAADLNNFYDDANYGQGWVHRAVLIDTPHLGSPLADFAEDIVDDVVNGLLLTLGRNAFIDLYHEDPDALPFAFMQPSGGGWLANEFELTPAVDDLKAIGGTRFGETPLPSHLVAGDLVAGTQTFLDLPPSVWYAVRLPRTLTKFLSKVALGMKLFGSSADKAFIESIEQLDEAAKALLVLNYSLRGYQVVSVIMEGDGVVSVGSQTAGQGDVGTTTVLDGFDNFHVGRVVANAGPTVGSVLEGSDSGFAPIPGASGFAREAPLAAAHPRARSSFHPDPPALRTSGVTITAPAAGSTVFVDSTLTVEITLADTTGLQDVTVFFQGSSHVSTVQSFTHRFSLQVSPEAIETQRVEAYAIYEDSTGTSLAAADVLVEVATESPLVAFSVTPERNEMSAGTLLYPEYVATFETYLSRLSHASTRIAATVDDLAVVAFDAERKAFRAVGPGGTFAVVTYEGLADTLYFTVNGEPAAGGFSVDIEPVGGTPVTVPADGGAFDFEVTLANPTAEPVSVEGWIDVALPDGSAYGPTAGPAPLSLAPGDTLRLALRQTVPAGAPAGTYTYTARTGTTYPATEHSDSFIFTKLPPATARLAGRATSPIRTPRSDGTSLRDESLRSGAAQTAPPAGRRGVLQYAPTASPEQEAQATARPASAGRGDGERGVTPAPAPFAFDLAEWPVVDARTGRPFGATSETVAAAPGDEAEAAASGVALPTEPALYPAYPNPFTATTTLRYNLSQPGPVRLAVYDALGRRVAVLVDETREPGRYRVAFDASGLASGVYVVQMRAADYVETRRLTLVR